jgi:hypothetical protein
MAQNTKYTGVDVKKLAVFLLASLLSIYCFSEEYYYKANTEYNAKIDFNFVYSDFGDVLYQCSIELRFENNEMIIEKVNYDRILRVTNNDENELIDWKYIKILDGLHIKSIDIFQNNNSEDLSYINQIITDACLSYNITIPDNFESDIINREYLITTIGILGKLNKEVNEDNKVVEINDKKIKLIFSTKNKNIVYSSFNYENYLPMAYSTEITLGN